MKNMMHPIVAAGLTAFLTLGTVGCSTSSSSTTTTEITTTDEDGNTTTETTTTTTDESGTTTETTTTSDADDEWTGYGNEYYKVGLEIPEGFSKVDSTEEASEGMDVDYAIANEDGTSNATIYLVTGATEQEGVTDVESWASVYADAATEAIEAAGGTVDVSTADFSIGDVDYGACARVVGNVDGKDYYTDLYFILDEDGDGMLIQFNTQSEEDMETLRDSIRGL